MPTFVMKRGAETVDLEIHLLKIQKEFINPLTHVKLKEHECLWWMTTSHKMTLSKYEIFILIDSKYFTLTLLVLTQILYKYLELLIDRSIDKEY